MILQTLPLVVTRLAAWYNRWDRYRAVLANLRTHTGGDHRLEQIDDLLLTHVHGDHMNGLEMVAFYKFFVQDRRLRLHTSPEVRAVVWDQRLRGSMGTLWQDGALRPKQFSDYFDYRPLSWDRPNPIGPFSVRTYRTRHHVPTSALLFEAEGAVLGYSADTVFDPELIAFLEPADLIIHETNVGPSHTELASLLTLPEPVRRKLRLIHYPDSFDVDASPIRALREGEVLSLEPEEAKSAVTRPDDRLAAHHRSRAAQELTAPPPISARPPTRSYQFPGLARSGVASSGSKT